MGRQALLVALMLAVFTVAASAQWVPTKWRSPLVREQQAPVYLKSLTKARDEKGAEGEDLEAEARLYDSIDRVGRAFRAGDADVLEGCLVSGKRKIYLLLETDDGQKGHYGPGQVRHIFARLFREIETRDFEYDSRELERYSGAIVFRADWTYVVVDTDELVTERLQFKLEQTDDDWRIYEIRAATR